MMAEIFERFRNQDGFTLVAVAAIVPGKCPNCQGSGCLPMPSQRLNADIGGHCRRKVVELKKYACN